VVCGWGWWRLELH